MERGCAAGLGPDGARSACRCGRGGLRHGPAAGALGRRAVPRAVPGRAGFSRPAPRQTSRHGNQARCRRSDGVAGPSRPCSSADAMGGRPAGQHGDSPRRAMGPAGDLDFMARRRELSTAPARTTCVPRRPACPSVCPLPVPFQGLGTWPQTRAGGAGAPMGGWRTLRVVRGDVGVRASATPASEAAARRALRRRSFRTARPSIATLVAAPAGTR